MSSAGTPTASLWHTQSGKVPVHCGLDKPIKKLDFVEPDRPYQIAQVAYQDITLP